MRAFKGVLAAFKGLKGAFKWDSELLSGIRSF